MKSEKGTRNDRRCAQKPAVAKRSGGLASAAIQSGLDAVQNELRFYQVAFDLLRESKPSAARADRLANLQIRVFNLKCRLETITR